MGRPELIARQWESEAARTRDLFDEYGRMVLVLCRALLRGQPDAEDAAQQTFLAAYRSLLTGHRPRHPAAWLATIARNECRAQQANRDALSVPLPLEVEAAHLDPAEITARHAELAALSDALAELPERQREVVRLHCLDGLTYGEVAEILDISSRAVDGLLVRARSRLRRRMREFWRISPLVVADSLRERLVRVIPGFEAGSGAAAVAAGGGAGGLAAAGALPLTAKLAVGAVGVAVLGSAGAKAPESQQAHASATARPAVSYATTPERPSLAFGGRSGRVERTVLRLPSQRGRSDGGPRHGRHVDDGARPAHDNSGSGRSGSGGSESSTSEASSSGRGSSGAGSSRSSSSGSGSSGSDGSSSGSSGSASSGSGSSRSGSSGSGSSGSGSSGSESSGADHSGSGSSGSGSSGPSDPADEPDD
jgi:RNA polymerase sigma factor (sigma-70 family)